MKKNLQNSFVLTLSYGSIIKEILTMFWKASESVSADHGLTLLKINDRDNIMK